MLHLPVEWITMLNRCLSCYRPFSTNDVLAPLPHGRRFAFDPARGRLWVLCDACSQWTLIPIEERWEGIEALERAVRDSGRLLAHTANITLHQARGLRIVRVGRAGGREAAWWRYGAELRARDRRARSIVFRGKVVDALVAMAVVGIPFWGYRNAESRLERAAARRLGKYVWRGDARCVRCSRRLPDLFFRERGELRLERWGDAELAVRQPCHHCGYVAAGSGAFLTGAAAQHVLRRALAFENFAGADESTLDQAVSVVESHPTARALLLRTATDGYALARIDAAGTLALEMALNEEVEREWLELEVKELEARWREEEELAGIVDRELT